MIFIHRLNGRDENIPAPCAVGGYDLSRHNFEVALRTMMRDDFTGVAYAAWSDTEALMAGRAVNNIIAVIIPGDPVEVAGTTLATFTVKVASYFSYPHYDGTDSLLARLAAYVEAGISADDVEHILRNPADARHYRELAA